MLNDMNKLLMDLLESNKNVTGIYYSTDIQELGEYEVVVDLNNGKSFKISIEAYN